VGAANDDWLLAQYAASSGAIVSIGSGGSLQTPGIPGPFRPNFDRFALRVGFRSPTHQILGARTCPGLAGSRTMS